MQQIIKIENNRCCYKTKEKCEWTDNLTKYNVFFNGDIDSFELLLCSFHYHILSAHGFRLQLVDI